MKLEKTTAFITGASRGIGRSLALALADSGATVVGFARESAELDSLVDAPNVHGWPADVTTTEIQTAIRDASAKFGAPNFVVACAGNVQSVGPLKDVDPDAWWRGITTDVRGTMLTLQAALQSMSNAGVKDGRIATVYGNLGNAGMANVSAFAAGKAAIASLTENAALEAASDGITVVGIHPGFVRTPATEHLAFGEAAKHLGGFPAVAPSHWETADNVVRFVRHIARGDFDDCSGRILHTDDFVADGLTEARRRFSQDDDYLRIRLRWTSAE